MCVCVLFSRRSLLCTRKTPHAPPTTLRVGLLVLCRCAFIMTFSYLMVLPSFVLVFPLTHPNSRAMSSGWRQAVLAWPQSCLPTLTRTLPSLSTASTGYAQTTATLITATTSHTATQSPEAQTLPRTLTRFRLLLTCAFGAAGPVHWWWRIVCEPRRLMDTICCYWEAGSGSCHGGQPQWRVHATLG